ncbi:MAG TPA: toxin-antitoxin system YwqK family antitoxin [Taishania sp.]|nr:toxin-antitoxin system YwqK family antitoxin [Taishania sp.]
MKQLIFILSILLLGTRVLAQITSLKNTSNEQPCYMKAVEQRKKTIDSWECGKLAGVVDCNEELEYSHEADLFLKKAKDNVNRTGAGKPFTGTCESCFMNGLIERRISFVNGKEHGVDTTYYEDGCIQAIRSHIQGAESGTWMYFYDSTQVKAWEMNYYLGQKHGVQIYFNANGDTTKYETYKDGVLHGLRKQYYKGSKLYKEINYVNGLLDGKSKMYNTNGVVIEESNYLQNKRHGVQKFFYDDGVLLRTENWDNGVKSGEFKMFYYQGHIQTLETYDKKGQKEGKFEEYYPDQKPKRLAVYSKNVLIEDHHYDEHGNETYSFGAPTTSDAEDDQIQRSTKKKK